MKENFEKIVIALVLITTGPVLYKMIFGKKKTTVPQMSKDVSVD